MDLESDVIQDAAFCTCMGVSVSQPVNFSAQQRDGIRARQSNVTLGSLLAFLAVFGRVVVAQLMLAIVFGLTSYLAPAKMFIGPDESYFAFSFKDAVMVGGCTGDVCVHNYYNSLWEFVTEVDSSAEDRLAMALNVFRSRLYQVMSHKRSVLLTQIWAYRCQNGHMQVLYLAQVTYHLITSSDLYYLGLATGTLTIEALINLVFCFFAFSYSFVNLLKARSGEQQLARHFRLTWETMQVLITVCTTLGLYTVRQTFLVFILNQNGELLRKTTARAAAMCNLSDSCIVFKHNIVLVAITASLVLGAMAGIVACLTQKHAQWQGFEVVLLTGYLFYGEYVHRAQDVVLLLLARLLPRKFTRTFNVFEDAFRLMEARPIA
ncbi:hypothetical protein BBJ29_002331 [Phytophthora kernoviae]|uniref:Transmembrane protein n=1 Tax=Phytophthora kernoviae TaxID=325452 RepID=A0A3R7KHU3_9STRA|nr:hypothetical protein BBJ29_002331 [Phytophthora kernoviae]